MSYLLAHTARRARAGACGLDERTILNLPGFHGGAYVRVFVEDTSSRSWRRCPPEPRIRFRIADCSNEISLWFELSTAEARRNSRHKIETLLSAIQRFRDALEAEAMLYEQRERRPTSGKAAVR